MDNTQIKELIKQDPEQVVSIIEQRVRTTNFNEDQRRNDLLDYIAAKVSAQISPYLRIARQVRRGNYGKWVRFQELLEFYGFQNTLTRENNYGPLPQSWEDAGSLCPDACDLLDYIDFFNDLHAEEDRRKEKIFIESFNDWVKPALLWAFEKVDVSKSDKEIVSYIGKAFYSRFVDVRAESQGLVRIRRGGKSFYYMRRGINRFDFKEADVLQTILHGVYVEPLMEMTKKLTKSQTRFLITLNNYVRDDVEWMSTDEFYEKYPHKRMNYRKTAEELGINYESFAKTIQRIKKRII